MTLQHLDVALAIVNREVGASHKVTLRDAERIYDLVVEQLEGYKPLVTAVRIDQRVMLQFTEYSRVRLEVGFGRKEAPTRSAFAKFEPKLEYNDATPDRRGFFKRLLVELKDNWLPCVAGVAGLWFLMGRYGTPDGWTNLFNAAGQVVSIFVAVVMVFATVQRQPGPHLLSIFSRGGLDRYHLTDFFMVRLAISSVFTALAGVFVAKYTGVSEVIPISIAGMHWEPTRFRVLLGVVSTLLILQLVILFVSLPQYYFRRARNLLYADLERALLDNRYEQVQKELREQVDD